MGAMCLKTLNWGNDEGLGGGGRGRESGKTFAKKGGSCVGKGWRNIGKIVEG